MPKFNDSLTLRYPVENYGSDAPFVLFRQTTAKYDSNVGEDFAKYRPPSDEFGRERSQPELEGVEELAQGLRDQFGAIRDWFETPYDDESILDPRRRIMDLESDMVGIYLPAGFSISDTASWEQADTGAFGRLVQSFQRGTFTNDIRTIGGNIMDDGLGDPDASAVLLSNVGTAIGGGALGLAAKATGKIPGIGSLLSGVAGFSLLNIAAQELRKTSQTVLNPRQFMLFTGPSLRNFSLSFNFVPSSARESDMVHSIVKWFREGMYPELSQTGLSYIFPSAFMLTFENVGEDSIPRLPELALQNLSVTYNPNTMSYFERDGRPVEVNLELSFAELEPIHKDMVRRGY